MPRADSQVLQRTPVTVQFQVASSITAELLCAMIRPRSESAASQTPASQTPAIQTPEGPRRFRPPGDLEERIRSFWPDGEACPTELVVLADRAGVLLETDPDRLFAGLRAAAGQENPRFELLESETPEDQVRFRDRLDRLHRDPQLLERWLGLLSDVWSLARDQWEEGRAAAEIYGLELRPKLVRGGYDEVFHLVDCDFQGLLPRLFDDYASTGRPVIVVPTWLGPKAYVLSLPDHLLVTVHVPGWPNGPSAVTRERAKRFKALGDPTRMAILELIGYRPHTVGELAQAMRIAQPTVSTHVRLLRDAGLVVQLADGTRRLTADRDALKQLTEESLMAIGG